jgi:hypothetical protein
VLLGRILDSLIQENKLRLVAKVANRVWPTGG